MKEKIPRRTLLERIKNHEISAEEGVRLFQQLQSNTSMEAPSLNKQEHIFFRMNWERRNAAVNTSSLQLAGCTLIYTDHKEKGEQWKALVQKELGETIVVSPSDQFRKIDRQHYELHPQRLGDYAQLFSMLHNQQQLPKRILLDRCGKQGDMADSTDLYVFVNFIQALKQQKIKQADMLYLYSVEMEEVKPQFGAISGFAQCLKREEPQYRLRTIELRTETESILPVQQIAHIAAFEFQAGEEAVSIQYVQQDRFVELLSEYSVEEECVNISSDIFRENGVYLITGGFGGLGIMFAEYLAEKYKAKLILTGRSGLTAKKSEKIAELEAFGSEVMYVQGDVARDEDAVRLIAESKARFGHIQGIIHSAGLTRDAFVIHKEACDIASVLAPKLNGVIHLEEASKDEPLDFFSTFSSITGLIGNVGQSDYAYANRYLDYFAKWRKLRKRSGRSLSIEWPYWQDGGMRIGETNLAEFKSKLGIIPLERGAGIHAFEQALQTAETELLVVQGDAAKIRSSLPQAVLIIETSKSDVPLKQDMPPSESLKKPTVAFLKGLLSKEIKLPTVEINENENMDKYGIDSVMVMNLTRALEKTFGELSKTLFFEYQSLDALADYMTEHHYESLLQKFGQQPSARDEAKDTGAAQRKETGEYWIDQDPAPKPVWNPKINHSFSKQPSSSQGSSDQLFPLHTGQQAAKEATADIAIIGVSGRYPLAETLEQYWGNLQQGRDCIVEIPKDRWDYQLYYDPDKSRKGMSYAKWGGFLHHVDRFDPLFFSISPREAEIMDPQERLFLEASWHAIEDAGYTRHSLDKDRNIGVFVGVMYGHYQLYGADEELRSKDFVPVSSFASIANRVSYHLNFQGPSLALDTMCSSSLTSIHLACESIRSGECEAAIAGGVNVTIHPNKYIQLSKGNFASTDGTCRSFGDGGDGYVPGEGVGAIVLKPLHKAVRDRDHIYGIIKGTSINHGGKTNGYTVPNPNAQAALIRRAIEKAQIEPRTISYMEAHGTGTSLGDPIEVAGLSKAFSEAQAKWQSASEAISADKQFCPIGSAKSNIGHLESAAGIAGVTKVLLQMKHKQIVPSIHSDTLNANIRFSETPFYVNQQLTSWEQPVFNIKGEKVTYPRRAGISSFGAGGSNAHVILEEYGEVEKKEQEDDGSPVILIFSAKNEQRLRQYAVDYVTFLTQTTFLLRDISYTLQIGREAMEERLALIAATKQEAIEKLQHYLQGDTSVDGLYQGNVRTIQQGRGLLIDGEEGRAFLELIVRQSKQAKLAQLWVIGENIDWSLLYEGERGSRISLPVYPFARERYWVPEKKQVLSSGVAYSEAQGGVAADEPIQLLVKSWRPDASHQNQTDHSANPEAVKRLQGKSAEQTWGTHLQGALLFPEVLLFIVNEQTRELVCELENRIGHAETIIADMEQLPQAVCNRAGNIPESLGIIDLSDLAAGTGDVLELSYRKLGFLQEQLQPGPLQRLQILHITKGLQSFENTGEATLRGALIAGFIKMISSEYRKAEAKTIDMDQSFLHVDGLSQIIRQEWMLSYDYSEICYRNGERFTPYMKVHNTHVGERENSSFQDSFSSLKINADQIYIITGGTRGIGAEMAKYLVLQGARKLALMGVQPYPPRQEWGRLLHHSRTDKNMKDRLQAIMDIEAQGAQVQLYTGSLSDKPSLQRFFAALREGTGSIGGVLHCAGATSQENPAFIKKRREDMERVFEPKIYGLHTLHECLKEDDLQFFVLFSSVSAVVPALAAGASDYAAANAYMDYFTNYQHQSGHTCYRSVQWPNWKEVGMGEVQSPAYLQLGFGAHSTSKGLEMFEQVMRSGLPICMPCTLHIDGIDRAHASSGAVDQLLRGRREEHRAVQNVQERNRDNRDTSAAVSPQAEYVWLAQLFAEELLIPLEQLHGDVDFAEFGVDSILLVDLVNRVEKELAVNNLDPTLFLEYPTLKQLSEYLAKHYASPMKALVAPTEGLNPNQSADDRKKLETRLMDKAAFEQTEGSKKPFSTLSREDHRDKSSGKIAVIGVACHFPGARDRQSFWSNLMNGKSGISEVPSSRWDVSRFYSPEYQEGKSISKWGGFIKDVEYFDPEYFNLLPEDAAQIDPLIRQFMEVSVQTLRDAGYEREELSNRKVGVFVGSRTASYVSRYKQLRKNSIIGFGQNFIGAHISHFFNFKGPNIVLDTACSSSLVSLHLACNSLLSGESEIALAGGVDILLDEHPYLVLSEGRALSPDGQCHTFDAKANGFVPGEGCGAVLLKPLEQALLDGDQIYAVIDSSAINNDGRTMGITTPNGEEQQHVIEEALRTGGIDPNTISYVETHGTGTMIGDPIELKALSRVYGNLTEETSYCGVGSVKSNIGHLLSAAGIASFIKVVLSLEQRKLPPTLNCETPNPRFEFADSPFYPNTALREWEQRNGIRRAGISSFGFGGTNAHLLVSELGAAASARYQPVRTALPPVIFNRKHYWLEKEEPVKSVKSSVPVLFEFEMI